jgi:uncharacterized coiled-coil protein SlyX
MDSTQDLSLDTKKSHQGFGSYDPNLISFQASNVNKLGSYDLFNIEKHMFDHLKVDTKIEVQDAGLDLANDFINEFIVEKRKIDDLWELQKTNINNQWQLINGKIPKMLSKFYDKIYNEKYKLETTNNNLFSELNLFKVKVHEYDIRINNQNKLINELFDKISKLETKNKSLSAELDLISNEFDVVKNPERNTE